MAYIYEHARPAITADCIVFARDKDDLKVLLIERGQEPFKGQWAFPGGFVEVGESLDDTAARELEEETGLKNIPLKQLYTFSRPDRDPREHIITVVYYTIIDLEGQKVKASSDARNAKWFFIDELPDLAFDHEEIFSHAYNHIMEKQ